MEEVAANKPWPNLPNSASAAVMQRAVAEKCSDVAIELPSDHDASVAVSQRDRIGVDTSISCVYDFYIAALAQASRLCECLSIVGDSGDDLVAPSYLDGVRGIASYSLSSYDRSTVVFSKSAIGTDDCIPRSGLV